MYIIKKTSSYILLLSAFEKHQITTFRLSAFLLQLTKKWY